jgi:hypothetical protein
MKFEYRVVTGHPDEIEPILNQLGAEGFEVITAEYEPNYTSPTYVDTKMPALIIILKRPVESDVA